MILIIDNYDSFTYNLVHLVAQSLADLRVVSSADPGGESADPGGESHRLDGLKVVRNDEITLKQIRELNPDGILISPGPGRPQDSGISREIVAETPEEWPILGVCLGHQIIGECFGGTVDYAPTLMHGKTSRIHHNEKSIFDSVDQDFTATRYHSLVISRATVPDQLEITAETADGIVMGLRHKTLPIQGIQFHPESILTIEGPKIISNWVNSCFSNVPGTSNA